MAAQKPRGGGQRRPGPDTPPAKKPSKPRTTPKTTAGIHKSAIKDVPTADLYAELRRRDRTQTGPKKAPRWTPAGQIAHRSRGGTK